MQVDIWFEWTKGSFEWQSNSIDVRGGSRDFEKGWLYVGHDAWPTKKILAFRWFKKAKITLETIIFWLIISINIFKFSPLLYTMKACQWNLFNFSKFANALHMLLSMEKKNLEQLDFVISVKQWSNYLNMNSCLHLSNKFKKCDKLFVNAPLKSLLYIYERVHRVAVWRPEIQLNWTPS